MISSVPNPWNKHKDKTTQKVDPYKACEKDEPCGIVKSNSTILKLVTCKWHSSSTNNFYHDFSAVW